MKKLLLSLGSVAAVAAPISAVIACSPSKGVDTHGIKVVKADGGFKLTLYEAKTKATGGTAILDAFYFVPKGATTVKVVKTAPSAQGKNDQTYVTLTLKEGTTLATNAVWKSSDGDVTGATTDPATKGDFGVSGFDIVDYVTKNNLKSSVISAFNMKVADSSKSATEPTVISESSLNSLNAILKDAGLVIVSTAVDAKKVDDSATTTETIANYDAVNKAFKEFSKVVYTDLPTGATLPAADKTTVVEDKAALISEFKLAGWTTATLPTALPLDAIFDKDNLVVTVVWKKADASASPKVVASVAIKVTAKNGTYSKTTEAKELKIATA